MPYCPTVFQRLLEPIDRRAFKRIVAAHDGDRGVGNGDRAWTCERHLKALLFSQFASLESLREIEQGLSARPHGFYHANLRAPRRSTLSDASAARPAAVFGALAARLAGTATQALRQDGQVLVQLLDATPIPLRDLRFQWAEADARLRGLKLHLLYDPEAQAPVRFALTGAKASDLSYARELPLEPGATYVFDKGYYDFRWWQDIAEAGAFFVTRLKGNAYRRQFDERKAEGEHILADRRLKLGHRRPRGGAPLNPLWQTELREVVVERPQSKPLLLVTNDLQRPAAEIAALYKQRWDIELLFKWLKQNLKIKRFLGRNENAVKIQIYVALIAFILLRLFRHRHGSTIKASDKTLLARIRVALFSPFNLREANKPPPKPPKLRPPPPQLSLKLQS